MSKIPGAFWIGLIGLLAMGVQTFVAVQWPESPPALAAAIVVVAGGLVGLAKALWPEPKVTPPPDAQAAVRMLESPPQRSRVSKFFF